MEQRSEKQTSNLEKGNIRLKSAIASLRSLLDSFEVVMSDRHETLTCDSDNAYYRYLYDLLMDEHAYTHNPEARLIMKAKLDQALRKFIKEVCMV